MKKHTLLLLVLIALIACKNEASKKEVPGAPVPTTVIDSFLITDSTWGLINARTGIEQLKKLYGESNIRDVRECDAECIDSIDVTKVYPGGENEITIFWKDTAYHKEIALIECYGARPRWHSAEGIRMGSGLKELLQANGRKISFYGFGWDYGGYISSFNGGQLDSSGLGYRLTLHEDYYGENALMGDTGLDTDMPVVKKAIDKISVWWITLSFYKPPVE